MKISIQKLPVTTLHNEIIDNILYKTNSPGITLAIYCFIERSDRIIFEETYIAELLGFDFHDVMLSLKALEKIGFIKFNHI